MAKRHRRAEIRLRRAVDRVAALALAPFASRRENNAVMIHIGRSGSVVLGNLLSQHSRLRWDGEIFEPGRHLLARGSDPIRFLKRRMALAGRHSYGCELKFFHARLIGMKFSALFDHFEAVGFDKFIVLRRENTLRKIVSSVVLHEIGRTHVSQGASTQPHSVRIDVGGVRIDRDRKPLIEYLEDYADRFTELDRLLGPREVLRLTYEEHIAEDPVCGYREVCRFLGTEPESVRISYAKTNPFPLSEIVINLDDVARVLRGTRFEWMLDA
jgi:hypothetical protein